MKTTLSIIKADVGGFPGHASVHPELMKKAEEELGNAKKNGLIKDYYVSFAQSRTFCANVAHRELDSRLRVKARQCRQHRI